MNAAQSLKFMDLDSVISNFRKRVKMKLKKKAYLTAWDQAFTSYCKSPSSYTFANFSVYELAKKAQLSYERATMHKEEDLLLEIYCHTSGLG